MHSASWTIHEDNILNGIEVIENEIIDGKLIAKEIPIKFFMEIPL